MAGLYSAYIAARCTVRPSLAPRSEERFTHRDRIKGIGEMLPVLLLITVVLGGIYSGLVTPSESAALGVVGALLLTGFYLSAMRRASIPEHRRQNFHLYLDEFHSFATSALVPILSESRKYRLSLTVAHQFLDQLQDDVRSAVFGNVGTLIAFRVGSQDAPLLAEHLDDTLPHQLTALANGDVCARLLSDGIPETFFASTTPPDFTRFGNGERLIDYSRARYTRPRAEVEDKIASRYGGDDDDHLHAQEVSRAPSAP